VVAAWHLEYNGAMTYVPRYLRVYLLDDHDLVRDGLRDLLVTAPDIDVVGDSGSAKAAARAIPELGVDVMVLDLRLQDGTGIEVCRAVRSVDPSIRGLLLTSSGDDEALVAAVLAGAAGYLVKLTRSSHVAFAIREVGAGRSLIDPGTLDRVSRLLLSGMDEVRPPLTGAERHVLTQVVEGLTDTQIAERMEVSLEVAAEQVSSLVERIIGSTSSASGSVHAGKHRRREE
jgi:DNA-binding NarL/FixJ family response regulator